MRLSVHDLLLAVRRHRLLFLSCVLVTLALGAYVAYSSPRSYTAQTQLFVSSAVGTSTDTLLQNSSLAQQRVPSYAELVSSPLVAQEVIKRLGLRASTEAVADKIQASSPLDVAVIDVTVHDDTALGAYRLATAVGDAFGGVVGQIEAAPNGRSPIRITVVRPPVLPQEPTGRRPSLLLAIALFVGLMLGAVAALVRARTDDPVYDAEELRSTLDLRPLATIVLSSHRWWSRRAGDAWPSATAAEGFRVLRTNLQAIVAAENLRSVLVTGALPGDGSSAVARDLAMAVGAAHMRVLLVEANLRDGGAGEQWGIDERAGLSQVLDGTVDVADVIQPWHNATIDVLPAGPPAANPSELLASQAMRDLISDLGDAYDLVLFDAPGVLAVTDAAVLATRTGGTILTVWLGRTTRGAVRRSVQTLTDLDVRLLGSAVLSGRSRRAQRWRRLQIDQVPPSGPPRTPDSRRPATPARVPEQAGTIYHAGPRRNGEGQRPSRPTPVGETAKKSSAGPASDPPSIGPTPIILPVVSTADVVPASSTRPARRGPVGRSASTSVPPQRKINGWERQHPARGTASVDEVPSDGQHISRAPKPDGEV
jgi:capsular exopolysaccharide synthesis family protein